MADPGQICMDQGEEALKTGVFYMRFQPDYNAAGLHFKGASDAYKRSGQTGLARMALGRCFECYIKVKDYQGAGYLYEQAASWDVSKRLEHFEKALEGYRLGNLTESMARMLTKIADSTIDDPSCSGQNMQRYLEILEIYERDEKEHMSGEIYHKLIGLLADQGNLSLLCKVIGDSAKMYERLGNAEYVYRDLLAKAVVLLCMNDEKGVQNLLTDGVGTLNFVTSDQYGDCEQLYACWMGDDVEGVQMVVAKPSFRFIAAPVMRMSKKLPEILREKVAERSDTRAKPTSTAIVQEEEVRQESVQQQPATASSGHTDRNGSSSSKEDTKKDSAEMPDLSGLDLS